MPFIVESSRPNLPTPRRIARQKGWLGRRVEFYTDALRLGGERFGLLLGIGGLAIGITISWLFTWLLGLALPWALVIVLAASLLMATEGAYRLWDNADKWASHLYPSWELLQDRADVLRAYGEANTADRDWPRFLSLYVASHRPATLWDFDLAQKLGVPLTISRDSLRRPANADEYFAIADAFEDAARRWREAERTL
jgi:hypothetical protein